MKLLFTKLEHEVRRWKESDWLFVVLAVAVVISTSLVMFDWGKDRLVVTHNGAPALSFILSVSIIFGYLYSWLIQHRNQHTTSLNKDLVAVVLWGELLIGVTAVSYFHGLAFTTAESNLSTGVALALFIGSGSLIGSLLARYRGILGALIAALILLLIVESPLVFTNLEQGLTNSNGASFLVLIIAGSLTTLVLVTIQIVKKQLSVYHRSRYYETFTPQRSLPSFTGTGGLFLIGCLSLIRDKFFALAVVVAVGIQIFLVSRGLIYSDSRQFSLSLALPMVIIAMTGLNLLEKHQVNLARKNLPIENNILPLTFFLSGLTIILSSQLIITLATLNLPFPIIISMMFSAIGGYSASLLIPLIPNVDFNSNKGSFDRTWITLFRGITFVLIFVLMYQFIALDQFMISLVFLTLTLINFGYRKPVRYATI